jgi:hypothetical protein
MGDIVCPKAVRIAQKREGGSENGEQRDGGSVELAFEVGRRRAAPLVDADMSGRIRLGLGTAIVGTWIGLGLKGLSEESARGEVETVARAPILNHQRKTHCYHSHRILNSHYLQECGVCP